MNTNVLILNMCMFYNEKIYGLSLITVNSLWFSASPTFAICLQVSARKEQGSIFCHVIEWALIFKIKITLWFKIYVILCQRQLKWTLFSNALCHRVFSNTCCLFHHAMSSPSQHIFFHKMYSNSEIEKLLIKGLYLTEIQKVEVLQPVGQNWEWCLWLIQTWRRQTPLIPISK